MGQCIDGKLREQNPTPTNYPTVSVKDLHLNYTNRGLTMGKTALETCGIVPPTQAQSARYDDTQNELYHPPQWATEVDTSLRPRQLREDEVEQKKQLTAYFDMTTPLWLDGPDAQEMVDDEESKVSSAVTEEERSSLDIAHWGLAHLVVMKLE